MKPVLVAIAIGASSAAIGQQSNPITPIDVSSVFTDPAGRTTEFETGAFGEVEKVTNTANLVTSVNRDSDGNPSSTASPDGGVSNQTFDALGNATSLTNQTLNGTATANFEAEFSQITQVSDPLSGTITIAYENSGNPTQLTTPEGRVVSATYQGSGLVSSLTDKLGTVYSLTYNSDQLPTRMVAGAGPSQRQGQRSYTSVGFVETDIDAESRVHDYGYDALGRLTQATLPDGRIITYGYDPASNLTRLTPPGRGTYGFTYNNVGLLSAIQYPAVTGGGSNQMAYTYSLDRQLTQISRADGININLAYDNAGRIETITQPDGNFSLSYGVSTGLLDSITSPDGIITSNTYNNELLTQVAWSGAVSGSVGYAYDAKGRISTFTIGGQSYTYAFDRDDDITQAGAQTLTFDAGSSLLTGTTLDAIDESFAYNQFAELTQHTVTAGAITLYDVAYTRDGLGRITRQIETIEGTTTTTDYTYDLAGRIETVMEDSTLVASYTYDSNDNRTDHGGNYDAQDRITAQTGIAYGYSAHGERTQKTEGANTTQYQYDAEGVLVGATLPNGDQVNYILDGQSRRMAKQLNGTTTEAWLYGADTFNIVARLDAANAVTQRYIYASRLHVPDYIDTGAIQYKVIADQLGSVRLVVDASDGTVAQRLDYDAWGNVTTDTNPNLQPFAYAGGLYDRDTELFHFGLREYDPLSTHWTSKDPIVFVGSLNNLYSYVSSEPINRIDHTGTDGRSTAKGVALGVFAKTFLAKVPFNAAASQLLAPTASEAAGIRAVSTSARVRLGITAIGKRSGVTLGSRAALAVTSGGAVVLVAATAAGLVGGALGTAIEPHVRSSVLPVVSSIGGYDDVVEDYPSSAPENILSERTLRRKRTDPTRRLGPRNQRRNLPDDC